MSGRKAGGRADEADLVTRLKEGDEGAFLGLVRLHHGSMIRVARSFVRSQAVAVEVAQEAWLGVIKGIARFEGRSSLRSWLFRIVSNRAMTRGTKERRSVPFSALATPDDMEGPTVDPSRFAKNGRWSDPPQRWETRDPERLLLATETLGVLQTALEALPPRQRVVVTLRDVEGCTSEEVCATLEVSEANQRVLLHRGRARVRQILEDHLR